MSHATSDSLSSPVSTRLLAACLSGFLLLAGGCATFHMPLPENFAKRGATNHSFSALTAEEEKLFARHFVVLEKQDIKFWTDAVRNNLVQERGYTLIEEGEFKTDGGAPGHRLLFEVSASDVPYRYLLVIFAARGWLRQHIFAVEFLSEKKNYDRHVGAVEKALKQFRPRRGRVVQQTAAAVAK